MQPRSGPRACRHPPHLPGTAKRRDLFGTGGSVPTRPLSPPSGSAPSSPPPPSSPYAYSRTFTSISPRSPVARNAGSYIASTCTGGSLNFPGDTARANV